MWNRVDLFPCFQMYVDEILRHRRGRIYATPHVMSRMTATSCFPFSETSVLSSHPTRPPTHIFGAACAHAQLRILAVGCRTGVLRMSLAGFCIWLPAHVFRKECILLHALTIAICVNDILKHARTKPAKALQRRPALRDVLMRCRYTAGRVFRHAQISKRVLPLSDTY